MIARLRLLLAQAWCAWFSERRDVSLVWTREYDRSIWREGNVNQVCWRWPVVKED